MEKINRLVQRGVSEVEAALDRVSKKAMQTWGISTARQRIRKSQLHKEQQDDYFKEGMKLQVYNSLDGEGIGKQPVYLRQVSCWGKPEKEARVRSCRILQATLRSPNVIPSSRGAISSVEQGCGMMWGTLLRVLLRLMCGEWIFRAQDRRKRPRREYGSNLQGQWRWLGQERWQWIKEGVENLKYSLEVELGRLKKIWVYMVSTLSGQTRLCTQRRGGRKRK